MGNNPEDMADLASKIGHAVDRIRQITSTLDGKANSVQWQGPDANRFKHSEWPTDKSQLARVSQSLQDVQQQAPSGIVSGGARATVYVDVKLKNVTGDSVAPWAR